MCPRNRGQISDMPILTRLKITPLYQSSAKKKKDFMGKFLLDSQGINISDNLGDICKLPDVPR